MLGVVAVLSAGRLAEYDTTPWGWVAAFGVATFLLAGPVAWTARSRLPEERRELLAYVGVGVLLFCVPFVLGLGLVTRALLVVLDTATLGGIVGLAVALLAERTVVPERLRGTTI